MLTDTLSNCVYALRAESGHSLSTSQGTNTVDTLKYLLKRTQLDLWTAYIWPTLVVAGDVNMAAGQYLYDYPATLSFEQVRGAFRGASDSANWQPLGYGISENYVKPGGANSESGDPPRGWRAEGDQFRVWPTPTSGSWWLRFKGMKPLNAFIADADVSTLDWLAIVLFTSAEVLARAKAEDASLKLKKAQNHLMSILGNNAKTKVTTLGADRSALPRPTQGVDYIPMTG